MLKNATVWKLFTPTNAARFQGCVIGVTPLRASVKER
jgi:hypothetical protein